METGEPSTSVVAASDDAAERPPPASGAADDEDVGDEEESAKLSSSQLDKIPLSCTIGSLSQSEKNFRTNEDDDDDDDGHGDRNDDDGDGDDGEKIRGDNKAAEEEAARKNLPDLVVNPYGNGVSSSGDDGGGRPSDPFSPMDYSGPATAEDTEPARPEDVYGIATKAIRNDDEDEDDDDGGGGGGGDGDDKRMTMSAPDDDVSSVQEADDGGSLDSSVVPSGGSSGLSSVGSSPLRPHDEDRDDMDDTGASEEDAAEMAQQQQMQQHESDKDGNDNDNDNDDDQYGFQSVKSDDAAAAEIEQDFDGDDDDDAYMASSLVRLSGDQKHDAIREKKKRTLAEASEDDDDDDDKGETRPAQQVMRGGGRGGMSKFEVMRRKRVALETTNTNDHDDDSSDDDSEESPQKRRTVRTQASKEASKIDALKRLARGGGKGRSSTKKLRFADEQDAEKKVTAATVTLLGSAQDGGLPQPGCYGQCCERARNDSLCRRMPVALGIAGSDGSKHLVEASRCFGEQLDLWKSCGTYPSSSGDSEEGGRSCPVDSICITHAHLGHVDGLGLFGREVIGAKELPVHCSVSFKHEGIEKNPTWRSMVEQGCIVPKGWDNTTEAASAVDEVTAFVPGSGQIYRDDNDDDSSEVTSKAGFIIRPIPVPHRAELSDTHALLFEGVPSGRRLLFLPDQDCWEKTLQAVGCASVREWLVEKLDVDIALLDGTFFNPQAELGNVRNVAEIPHPPVAETLVKLGKKSEDEGKDRRFIFCHLNHTNPLCNPISTERKLVEESGWEVAAEGDIFEL